MKAHYQTFFISQSKYESLQKSQGQEIVLHVMRTGTDIDNAHYLSAASFSFFISHYDPIMFLYTASNYSM